MRNILHEHKDLQVWVEEFLRTRTFNVKVDNKTIGKTTMTSGAPRGSPLSPALILIYMSTMIATAQKMLEETDHTKYRRMSSRKKLYIPLRFVNDCSGITIGSEKILYKEAGDEWGLEK